MKGGSSLTDKKEELEKRVKRLEKQLKQQQTQQHGHNHSSDESKEYSRRSFLKALGGGAAGLGAAAMIGNASAFRINSDQGLSYFNRSSNQSQFNVSPDGILDVKQIGTVKNPISSVHAETISTAQESIIERKILIYGAEGNTLDTLDPSEYSDYGSAINAASNRLPQHGDQNIHQGTILLPELDAVEYSTRIKAWEHLRIEGQGPSSTHLIYTGTDTAVKDVNIRGSGTNAFSLRDLRIDAPNGIAVDLYQPNNTIFQRFSTIGRSNDGTKGIVFHTDTSKCNKAEFNDCRFQNYEVNFDIVDDSGNENQLVFGNFVNCKSDTDHPSGIAFRGPFFGCTWVNGNCHGAEKACFDMRGSAENRIFGFHMEGVNRVGTGIDARNAEGRILSFGSRYLANIPFADPNDQITAIGNSMGYADNIYNGSIRFNDGLSGSKTDTPVESMVLENFERGTLSYYTGKVDDFGFSTDVMRSGTQSLEKFGPAGEGIHTNDISIQRGRKYQIWVRDKQASGDDGTIATHWAGPDLANGYRITINTDANNFSLGKKGGNSTSAADSTNVTLATQIWYLLTFKMKFDGTVVATISNESRTELASLSITNNEFASGGFGVRSNNTTRAYWDLLTQNLIL